MSKRLLVGAFSQNLFAAHVGISQIQPVITYQLGHGWALSAGDSQLVSRCCRPRASLPPGAEVMPPHSSTARLGSLEVLLEKVVEKRSNDSDRTELPDVLPRG